MRNMSFALTEQQVLQRTKSVTRRLGWLMLQPGHLVQPVRKGMGLRPGEKIVRLGGPVRVVSVRREPLRQMTDDPDYGFSEVALEGFGDHPTLQWPSEFVAFFCGSHRGCAPATIVTRIEFAYTT
jgi:hypothetical protein